MPHPPDHLLNQVLARLQKTRGPMEPRVFWDAEPHPAGTRLQVGPRTVELPFEGYHVFADLEPGVNWSHRAVCYLVPTDPGIEAQEVSVTFPPFEEGAEAPFEPLSLA